MPTFIPERNYKKPTRRRATRTTTLRAFTFATPPKEDNAEQLAPQDLEDAKKLSEVNTNVVNSPKSTRQLEPLLDQLRDSLKENTLQEDGDDLPTDPNRNALLDSPSRILVSSSNLNNLSPRKRIISVNDENVANSKFVDSQFSAHKLFSKQTLDMATIGNTSGRISEENASHRSPEKDVNSKLFVPISDIKSASKSFVISSPVSQSRNNSVLNVTESGSKNSRIFKSRRVVDNILDNYTLFTSPKNIPSQLHETRLRSPARSSSKPDMVSASREITLHQKEVTSKSLEKVGNNEKPLNVSKGARKSLLFNSTLDLKEQTNSATSDIPEDVMAIPLEADDKQQEAVANLPVETSSGIPIRGLEIFQSPKIVAITEKQVLPLPKFTNIDVVTAHQNTHEPNTINNSSPLICRSSANLQKENSLIPTSSPVIASSELMSKNTANEHSKNIASESFHSSESYSSSESSVEHGPPVVSSNLQKLKIKHSNEKFEHTTVNKRQLEERSEESVASKISRQENSPQKGLGKQTIPKKGSVKKMPSHQSSTVLDKFDQLISETNLLKQKEKSPKTGILDEMSVKKLPSQGTLNVQNSLQDFEKLISETDTTNEKEKKTRKGPKQQSILRNGSVKQIPVQQTSTVLDKFDQLISKPNSIKQKEKSPKKGIFDEMSVKKLASQETLNVQNSPQDIEKLISQTDMTNQNEKKTHKEPKQPKILEKGSVKKIQSEQSSTVLNKPDKFDQLIADTNLANQKEKPPEKRIHDKTSVKKTPSRGTLSVQNSLQGFDKRISETDTTNAKEKPIHEVPKQQKEMEKRSGKQIASQETGNLQNSVDGFDKCISDTITRNVNIERQSLLPESSLNKLPDCDTQDNTTPKASVSKLRDRRTHILSKGMLSPISEKDTFESGKVSSDKLTTTNLESHLTKSKIHSSQTGIVSANTIEKRSDCSTMVSSAQTSNSNSVTMQDRTQTNRVNSTENTETGAMPQVTNKGLVARNTFGELKDVSRTTSSSKSRSSPQLTFENNNGDSDIRISTPKPVMIGESTSNRKLSNFFNLPLSPDEIGEPPLSPEETDTPSTQTLKNLGKKQAKINQLSSTTTKKNITKPTRKTVESAPKPRASTSVKISETEKKKLTDNVSNLPESETGSKKSRIWERKREATTYVEEADNSPASARSVRHSLRNVESAASASEIPSHEIGNDSGLGNNDVQMETEEFSEDICFSDLAYEKEIIACRKNIKVVSKSDWAWPPLPKKPRVKKPKPVVSNIRYWVGNKKCPRGNGKPLDLDIFATLLEETVTEMRDELDLDEGDFEFLRNYQDAVEKELHQDIASVEDYISKNKELKKFQVKLKDLNDKRFKIRQELFRAKVYM